MFLSRKQLTILIVVLLLLTSAAVATTIWAVFFPGPGDPTDLTRLSPPEYGTESKTAGG